MTLPAAVIGVPRARVLKSKRAIHAWQTVATIIRSGKIELGAGEMGKTGKMGKMGKER